MLTLLYGAEQLADPCCYEAVQFYLMKEGQLTLLTEPNDLQTPGYEAVQFYLMKEGQLTLLTEPTTCRPPATSPDSFTSCRRGGLGESKAVRPLLPRTATVPVLLV